ncbi:MAG: LamG domain-containing protein, partial [Candidatus Electryonea clarkiae]|nr:LamG domain-containing protein [Candidatus Electryonea clarkiae]
FQSSSPYITNILGEEGAGSSAFLRLGDASLANNKLQFILWIGSAQTKLDGVTALSANVWYHVATTYDGSNMRIYINGIEDASKSQTGSITANSTFYLSQPEAGRYFDGLLDEVRVLNDARSESEIRQNMYRELPNPSETNLVAYYKFNETSGIIADNAQGNASYDGALTNYGSQSGYWQTSTVIDAPKKCLDFDGVDDFVEIGSNFGLGTNTLSVECWVYIPNVSEKGTFINVGGSANGYAIGVGGTTFEDNGNKLIYINDMKTWHSTGTDIGIGWHHVAYTIDASNNTIIYLDGINVHSFTETPLTPSNAAYIGSSDNVGGRLFTGGKIDEVRIWNTARSATEIRDEMCNNLMGDESGLVGYYRCDFGSDLTLYDQTSSDNNGTLTNMDNSDWLTSYAMVLAEDATDVEGTSFTANWDCPGSNSSFDDGYTIEYSTTSDFSSGNATTTASSSETSKSITGLTSRTAYYYHVSGKRSGSATLEYSNVQSLTTIPQAPLYCLDFDGSNDYVDCGNISLSGSAITMECWVNVDAFQSSPPYISQLIGTESESNSAFLRLGDADISAGNKIEFVLNLGGVIQQLTSVSTLDIDRWYHIAGTYDGSTMIIYINGELDASDNQSGSVVSNSTFSIGAQYDGSNDGRHLDGSLDEVRVWSTARTATEISDNMCNAIITEDVSGLVAYYRCDHGSGTTLYDQASNESNGTFGGSPSWINSYAMVLAEDATSVTNAGFTANWDCPGTVSNFDYGYTIDYSTSVDFSSSTTLTASSSETSKTITGLTANTPYYYRVSGDRTVSDDPQYSNVKSLTTSASFSPVVTSNLDDGGTGTLRYIIANCGTGDEITFNLSSGDEIITIGSQIIVEANPKSITIDGDNTVGSGTDVSIQVTTPGVSIYRVFEFNPGTGYPISLKNMTLKGGNISGTAYDGHSGGSLYIYNCQSFTLENVTIEGSTATNGGGIYIFNSPVTLINCEISNTQAASSGGGIYNTDDQLFTLTSSSFSNCTANNGGGLSLGGPTTASDITIDNCTATFYGGGIYNYRNLTLTDSKITNNSAGSNGGGIYCEFNQSLSIIGSTISGNSSTSKGGGLYVSAEDNNQTSLNNSTVSNNSSADGGGIYAYSYDSEDPYVLNLILSNCTMSGNTCSSNGAGVYATDDNSAATNVYLTNSIVTYNYKSDNSAYVDLFNSNATFYGNYNIIGGLALSGSN